MSPGWIVTLILLVGVTLVVVATIADRRSERRMAGEPRRPRPLGGGSPDVEVPVHLTAADLLAGARPAAPFDASEEQELAIQLEAATKLDLMLGAPTLATHTGNRAILERPLVLVAADQVDQLRELLHVLGAAAQDRRALLVAAPAMDADTLQTVIANKLGGKLDVAVAFGTVEALTELAAATGTTAVSLADRQAGLPRGSKLGHAWRVIIDENSCWVIDEPTQN